MFSTEISQNQINFASDIEMILLKFPKISFLLSSHIYICRGVLMDDAMILSCGHSYGSGGMQHIYRMVCQRILTHLIFY